MSLTDPAVTMAAVEAEQVRRSSWWLGRYRRRSTAHRRPSQLDPSLVTTTGLGWPVGAGRAR